MGETECGNGRILRSGQWDWNSVEQAVALECHQVVVCGSGRMLRIVILSSGDVWHPVRGQAPGTVFLNEFTTPILLHTFVHLISPPNFLPVPVSLSVL